MNWISIKDKMPDTEVDVLVYGYYGCSVAMITPNGLWWFDDGTLDEPTHWMPLPEAP